ncbi:uncharacterized mitochondrial protein AtMg00810-like [Lotus japonicus]|uniref:uncharacterized mitochondrial protein AtMg00810-like n=1 Tax=Lotus japonicus TaxID=34305 RepID=UPI002589B9FA|nr:uncharacterized mitochondrial protein AtMg00810-like [Lotus japonicus]
MVYRLDKALYGLKQAPRAWNKKIDAFFVEHSFKKCSVEYGLYVKHCEGKNLLLVCLYVDDLLITGDSIHDIDKLKVLLKSEFEMTDLGKVAYFLGMQFHYTDKGVLLHQGKYVREVLGRFKMSDCNPSRTPAEVIQKFDSTVEERVDATEYKQLVGSLRYLCNSRPDICYAVGVLSRFMSEPQKSHLLAAKRVLRYVKGTSDLGIWFPMYGGQGNVDLYGFSDSDWCGDKLDRRSTTGYLFMFQGAPISWVSKKQPVVALSSCEAEYIAGCYAACQAAWLSALLTELGVQLEGSVCLRIDNKSTINLAKNPVAHGRSKHIETRFHFIREQVEKGRLKLVHCGTLDQVADLLTKAVKGDQFEKLRQECDVVSIADI